MKRVLLGFVSLLALLLISIAAASTDQPKDGGKQSAQVSTSQSVTPQPQASEVTPTVKHKAVLTQTEADSLCVHGDSLLAQSGVDTVPVGSLGSSEVIYILVVVLLVVVIVAVVAH
jgi:hypothetical protein